MKQLRELPNGKTCSRGNLGTLALTCILFIVPACGVKSQPANGVGRSAIPAESPTERVDKGALELVGAYYQAWDAADGEQLSRVLTRAELERTAQVAMFTAPTMSPEELAEFSDACERFGITMEKADDPAGFLSFAIPKLRALNTQRGLAESGRTHVEEARVERVTMDITITEGSESIRVRVLIVREGGQLKIGGIGPAD